MKGTWPGVLALLVLGLIGLGLLLGGSPPPVTSEPDIHAIIQRSVDSPDRTDQRMATWTETPKNTPPGSAVTPWVFCARYVEAYRDVKAHSLNKGEIAMFYHELVKWGCHPYVLND